LVDDLQQVESPDSVKSTRLSIDWQNTFQVNANHQLVAGAYLAQETGKALSFGLGFDEDVDIRAAYVQDQYRNDRFQALVGIRLSDHEAFGNELTWNAGAGYDVTDQFTLQIDAGRAFRAPDTTDRFGFGGNQDLDAETSMQYQLRGIYSLDNGLRISVEAFRNEIDDLIEFDFATFQLFIIAEATIEGVSADARWVNDRWQVEVGITHQDARNAETDTRLLRRARVTSSARISRRFGQHSVDLSWRSDDARRDFGGVRLAGYGIASISGRFALADDLALTARVDNVTDKEFETAAGFNQLGRTTTVQLRYTF
ncbi:MAG: TonB-dependent receptor, partial [Pseudomonadota bacterium]